MSDTALGDQVLNVYQHVARFRRDQNWGQCDLALRGAALDADLTDLCVLVAMLMSTATIPRGLLPHWAALYERTRARYSRERGEVEAAAALDSLE